jgi:site-specific recombinase XerC
MKRYLTEAEQQRLLRAAKTNTCPLAQRDYWCMRLLIETGARVEEFSLFSAEQAEDALRTGWLVVLPWQRKGRAKGQEYAVMPSVRACLEALLAMQRAVVPPSDLEGPAPLVWGREGQRLSVRSYQARVQHWADAAGLGLKVSPHWLRHTRGMNIMRRSRSTNALKVAQRALGHASLASTGMYLEMDREEYTRELQACDTARMGKRAAVALATKKHAQQHAQEACA